VRLDRDFEDPGLHDLIMSHDGRQAYGALTRVPPRQDLPLHFVVVVDGMTITLRKLIALPMRPTRVALSPLGNVLYVTHGEGGAVSVVDIEHGKTVRTIRVGGYPKDIAVHPSGDVFFIADDLREAVAVVDVTQSRVVALVDRCH
jgi:YVTN family beta-propeller protein